jgi:hypothetical protein
MIYISVHNDDRRHKKLLYTESAGMFVILSLYVDSHVSKGLLDSFSNWNWIIWNQQVVKHSTKNSPIYKVHHFFKVWLQQKILKTMQMLTLVSLLPQVCITTVLVPLLMAGNYKLQRFSSLMVWCSYQVLWKFLSRF